MEWRAGLQQNFGHAIDMTTCSVMDSTTDQSCFMSGLKTKGCIVFVLIVNWEECRLEVNNPGPSRTAKDVMTVIWAALRECGC